MTSSLTVVGLGYVGLPMALEACRVGMRVSGLDSDPSVASGLTAGLSHVDDIDSTDIAEMLTLGFNATTDPGCIGDSDVIIICVPTPLDKDRNPDLAAVKEAAITVAEHLQPGSLIVLESTTYPGTTEDMVQPLVEEKSGLTAGVDFNLVYSPERIDPGNPEWGLCNTPKIVGGLTSACTERGVQFYSQFVDTVVPTVGLREAEFAKLLENTYRHVNIALINEMAVFCHEIGIDLWASIDAAATKPFGFEAFRPGPGVGGHCIPIDPNYLSWVAKRIGYRLRFVELAQEVSERMPAYVARRAQDALNRSMKPMNGSRIVIAGVTYKANVSDQRESPAKPVTAHLKAMGANVSFIDSHVDSFTVAGEEIPRIVDIGDVAKAADVLIILQAHNEFLDSRELGHVDCILDTSGKFFGDNVDRL
ncbi:MAG: nucleotide sugar dehydrogenase [Acidimicrobiales bacterium]|nr:nucleotide sugar dehydrogenase [Acidimicrobiales bacterium]|tara:strand:+ start:10208 stop:11467 length:1260 start_codon:yes stop_codon:yes gene_type:complete